MHIEYCNLSDHPEMAEKAAQWFHEKWKVPYEEYLTSINQSLCAQSAVPQWYIALSQGSIVGGLGVIENDFHNRKDLTPNVCAVYVEEPFRCRGIAGKLLALVCSDMKRRGISTLYLITDHTLLYERYGWSFLCMVQGDGEEGLTRMYVHEEA